MTPEEDEVLEFHLDLAKRHGLPVVVHTPHRDKKHGTRRTLEVIAHSGIAPELVVLDHLNEVTVDLVADSGCWMGFSIYPDTKMDPDRMVAILQRLGTERMLVNSAADWGRSDPLTTARTGRAMLWAGYSEAEVDAVLWGNPVAFYGQSGRLDVTPLPGFDLASEPATFSGNSILRGAVVAPAVEAR
jgi:predicted metal-dependent TIM-barrel fold hydrolase